MAVNLLEFKSLLFLVLSDSKEVYGVTHELILWCLAHADTATDGQCARVRLRKIFRTSQIKIINDSFKFCNASLFFF